MYCPRCGKYNSDNNSKCSNCGFSFSAYERLKDNVSSNISNTNSKTLQGVLLCILLGFIGLIIGIVVYKEPHERETFLLGWFKTLITTIIIAVVVCVVVVLSLLS